jgi:hypothetical protein
MNQKDLTSSNLIEKTPSLWLFIILGGLALLFLAPMIMRLSAQNILAYKALRSALEG